MDNTNFVAGGGFFGRRGGGGARANLPIDDDVIALRQAIWRATDRDYKAAVETLTKKKAYMKDFELEDRPPDFSKVEPVKLIEPTAEIAFNRSKWEKNIARLSARFKQFDNIQNSNVNLLTAAGNSYVVNSEGTRLRSGDTGVLLSITADLQCDDGMRLADGLTYVGESVDDLPSLDAIEPDIDKMVEKITAAASAPKLEEYTGPVLFDAIAAAQLLKAVLVPRLAGNPDPVGMTRRASSHDAPMEDKIGRRILPKSFQIYDDPRQKAYQDEFLFGYYVHDDEGVPARRVDLVVDGVLETLVMSRAPIKKISGSTGHGRAGASGGDIEARIGCLYVTCNDGLSDDELKKELIAAAQDEDLEYGLWIRSMKSSTIGASPDPVSMRRLYMAMQSGGPAVPDPVYAYKVYVEDGRQELIRGVEFGSVDVRNFKRILAAGDKPEVYNYVDAGFSGSAPPTSIIAPAMLFEELELTKIKAEFEKSPILKPPAQRDVP
jgi:hypothetical protein